MSEAARRQFPSWPIVAVRVIVGRSSAASVPLTVRDMLDEQLALKLEWSGGDCQHPTGEGVPAPPYSHAP
jgi:hypothetical protein